MNDLLRTNLRAVVVGVSAGGLEALSVLIPSLPGFFPLPVIVVQHHGQGDDDFLAEYLARLSDLPVRVPADKEPIRPGAVYIAPAGYHLLVEDGGTFSLSLDPPVNYCRPSIDVLFESAAEAYGAGVLGVILTGANADGSRGLKCIKDRGGLAIVQDPDTARSPCMPKEALLATAVDRVLPVAEIGPFLAQSSAGRPTNDTSIPSREA